jgi:tRNA-dihydrouridine synthase 3
MASPAIIRAVYALLLDPPRDYSSSLNAFDIFHGKLVLAPMTKGSNVPFRRLCRELGADVTVGEMALAYKVNQEKRSELALLRVHPEDRPFGAQLADRVPQSLAHAAARAEEMGSDFVDLNCGCPIDYFTSKGLGAALLDRPKKFGELVRAMRMAVTIPVTVKIRLGPNDREKNFLELAKIAEGEGANAIAMHARTREQRYSKAADWDRLAELKQAVSIPVIGNGDLLTHWEAHERWQRSGVDALMTARGALIKPWIFQEIKERRTIHKDAEQRLALYRRYVALALEHFGDDDHGRARVREFLIWHLEFLCRYRQLPEAVYDSPEFAHPLLQTRFTPPSTGEGLEFLLSRTDAAAHAHVAAIALGEIPVDAEPPPLPAAADARDDVVATATNG